MRASERPTARRQLDKRLSSLPKGKQTLPPSRGWIKAIREALGMTAAQLASRIGVTQPRIVEIEKAEVRGSLTLASVARVADALNCELVYTLVPRDPLEQMVQDRAHQLARQRLASIRHTMALEAQRAETDDDQSQLDQLTRKLAEEGGAALWESEE